MMKTLDDLKAKGRITVYSKEYVARARPKQAEYDDPLRDRQPAEEEVKFCVACDEEFQDGDLIHISKSKFGPKRRHLRCAIDKVVIDGRDVELLLRKTTLMDQVAMDMQKAIPQAIVEGFKPLQ